MAAGQGLAGLLGVFSLFLLLLLLRITEAAPTDNEGAMQLSPPLDNAMLPGSDSNATVEVTSLTHEQKPTLSTEPPTSIAIDGEKVASSTPTIPDQIKLSNGGRNTDTPAAKLDNGRPLSRGFLLYEVQRDVLGLSLDDINYVLDFGLDVFPYSLADKLGFLKNGKDDPHISVIDENKEQLMEKLKSLSEGFTKLKEEINDIWVTEISTTQGPIITTTPTPQEISKDSSRGKIAYDVATRLWNLSLETIDKLLSYDSELGTLPYAINYELGFSDDEDDRYFNYLIGKGDHLLREVLEDVKLRKLNETPIMEETKLDSVSQTELGDILDTFMPAGEMPQIADRDETLKVTEAEEIVTTAYKPLFIEVPYRNEETPGKTADNEDSSSYNIPAVLPSEPSDMEDPSEIYDESTELFDQMLEDDDFLEMLYIEDSELYLRLKQGYLDKETAFKLLESYMEWLDDLQEEEYDDSDNEEFDDEMEEPLEDGIWGAEQEVEPDVGQEEDQVDGKEEEEGEIEEEVIKPDYEDDNNEENDEEEYFVYDDVEPAESSSYGAVHFLTIFIIIGAAVVVCYLCLLNRKKVRIYWNAKIREGVGSYIADASKRRRRAREYKPVQQAIDNIQ